VGFAQAHRVPREIIFVFVGEAPTDTKVSALLRSLLAEGHRILGRIDISPILLKQILLGALCELCERRNLSVVVSFGCSYAALSTLTK
jgi:hypothetical protein